MNSDRKRNTTKKDGVAIYEECVNVTPAEIAIIPLGNNTKTVFDLEVGVDPVCKRNNVNREAVSAKLIE